MHTLRTLGGEQPGHDAMDLEILSTPVNHSADKAEDRDNDDSNDSNDDNMSPRHAKRQRSASIRWRTNLHHTSTLLLPHNEDGKGSIENIDGNVSDETGGDDISPKRQKLSDSQSGGTVLSSHSRPSLYPQLLSGYAKDDESESSSTNGDLTSAARTTHEACESAPVTEPQPSLETIDGSLDWEVRKIIGKEDIAGVPHYLVEWCPTLEPEHLLGHSKELVDEFEAQLRVQHGIKSAGGLLSLKAGQKVKGQVISLGSQQQKRARGRPRKQK